MFLERVEGFANVHRLRLPFGVKWNVGTFRQFSAIKHVATNKQYTLTTKSAQ